MQNEELKLPLDYSAIERILPHRYPFLLVDRIIEFEPDKRIVGIKNVSINERYLSTTSGNGRPALPPTILTEVVAQVGAILILAKPEYKDLLIFFRGHRARALSRPGVRRGRARGGGARQAPAQSDGRPGGPRQGRNPHRRQRHA